MLCPFMVQCGNIYVKKLYMLLVIFFGYEHQRCIGVVFFTISDGNKTKYVNKARNEMNINTIFNFDTTYIQQTTSKQTIYINNSFIGNITKIFKYSYSECQHIHIFNPYNQ